MSDDKKRLFFALWPDQKPRTAIVERTQNIMAECQGRVVKPDNIHVTLAFLHSVKSSLIPCITSAAMRTTRTPGFVLELSRIGFWPRSRIVWLAPSAPDAATSGTPDALATTLWRELEDCGFTPEQRQYQPHVTLARKVNLPPAVDKIETVKWPVRSFALVESVTGKRQSEYEVLKTFPLSCD